MSRRKHRRPAAAPAFAETLPSRRNLPAEARSLIADARNDITIPFYTGAMQYTDDTLIQRGEGKGLKIYDEIERDTHAWAVLQKRKKVLLSREWEVKPASDMQLDVDAADLIREILQALPFDRICEDLLDATLKGFAVSEIVWGRDGMRIVPERIVAHDQRRFVFDHDWRPRLLTWTNMMAGEPLPERKFIVHRHGVKGNNPYGLGLGTRLFWPVLFKREGITFWLHFLEKYAGPTVIGSTPYGGVKEQMDAFVATLSQIRTSAAVAVPTGADVKFLEAQRSGTSSYLEFLEYWDRQISICTLGETLTTDIGNAGSRAASQTHADILEMLVDADADLLSVTRAVTAQSAAIAAAHAEAVAYRADLEAIRAQFNPAAAAAQQYQKQLLAISAAEEMGAISAKEASAARKQAAAQLDAVGRSSAGAAGGLRGFGMQLNQVATVGGMTGDWMSALAIQLPDMLMAFGTLGVFLGVAAGAMIPFLSGLVDSADAGKVLTEANDALADSIDRARSSASAAVDDLDGLRQKYGQVDGDVRRLIESQAAYDKAMAARALRDARTAMTDYIAPGSFSASQGYALPDEAGLDPALSDRIVQVQELRTQLGLSAEDARTLVEQFDRLGAASGAAEMADAFASIRAEIAGAYGGVDALALSTADGADKARELYENAGRAEDAARQFAGIDMASAAARAADEAARLAANMGLALDGASATLAVMSRLNAQDALSRGMAGAGRGGDPRQYMTPEGSYLGPLGEDAQALIDADARRRASAARKGRGGKSDAERAADRAARQAERDAARVDDFIGDIQAEIDALRELDPIQQEIIHNREILDKASPAQRTQIEALIRQRSEVEGLRDAWDMVGDTMYDALEDAILQGGKLSDVLGGVGEMAAKAAFQAAMLGTGPLAGVLGFDGGGGLIGMGLSALAGSFDKGGWTGGSNPADIAGVVHAREYVFDAESTARIGVKNLDALRKGALAGYRSGGFVASGAAPALSGPAAGRERAAPREIVANFTINVQGTGNAEIEAGVRAAIGQALDDFDRNVLPTRVGQITTDHRRIG